jgi:hypothetical protein
VIGTTSKAIWGVGIAIPYAAEDAAFLAESYALGLDELSKATLPEEVSRVEYHRVTVAECPSGLTGPSFITWVNTARYSRVLRPTEESNLAVELSTLRLKGKSSSNLRLVSLYRGREFLGFE